MRPEGKIRYCRVGRSVLYKYPEQVEAFLSQYEKAASVKIGRGQGPDASCLTRDERSCSTGKIF